MKILMIGDIVGRLGRQMIAEFLPGIKKELQLDWVIANGENLAGGRGLNKKTVKEMEKAGVDIITSGNHVWFNDDGVKLLKKKDSSVLRPANYPPETTGRGWGLFTNSTGQRIGVINLIGRVYMRENFDCPFRRADEILNEMAKNNTNPDAVLIDFHAEVAAEKIALARYLDGRITALAGTHTHVQTNDAQILPKGTGYMTDLGMTGSADSILGVEQDVIIKQFLTQRPQKFVWKTSGPKILAGGLIETKPGSIKAVSFVPVTKYSDN